MAYSYVSYQGDGTTRDFIVPFPYLYQADVHVHIDGEELFQDTAWTWFDEGRIQFIVDPPRHGALLRIQRVTEKSRPEVNFTDGAVLGEADLDLIITQLLYIAQEAYDALSGETTDIRLVMAQTKDLLDRLSSLNTDDLVLSSYAMNIRKSFILDSPAASGDLITLPVNYYPKRDILFLSVDGMVCSPRKSDSLQGAWQYEEVGDDPDELSNQVRVRFDVEEGATIDVWVVASNLMKELAAMSAAARAAEQSATAARMAGVEAQTAKDAADDAKSAANAYAANAASSAEVAENKAAESAASAASASSCASEASAKATEAAGSAAAANSAKSGAESARSAAESSKTAAATSAGNATSSATAAAASATTASAKATEAANSATAANAAKTAAQTAKADAEAAAAAAQATQASRHAATHKTDAIDAITPADIGAVPENDSRLADARTPKPHTHAAADLSGVAPAPAPAAADADKKLLAAGAGSGKWAANASLVSTGGSGRAAIAVNGTFTVPSYVVGANQLSVYLEGCLCDPGIHYIEVGAAGAAGTSIKWLAAVPEGYTISVKVTP